MCLRKWLLGDVEIDNCPPRKERLRCNKKWLHGWKICQYPVWCWRKVRFYAAFFYSTRLDQNVCFLIINALIDKAIRHKMENLFPCFEGFGTLKFCWIFRRFEPHVTNGCTWGLQSNWNCSAMVLIALEPLMVWLVWNMSRVNVFTFSWRYFHLESCPSGEKVCRQEHGIDIFKIRGVEELEHWKIWFSRVLVVVWTWMRCLHGLVWEGSWKGQYWKCGSDHFGLDKFFLRGYQEMDSMLE